MWVQDPVVACTGAWRVRSRAREVDRGHCVRCEHRTEQPAWHCPGKELCTVKGPQKIGTYWKGGVKIISNIRIILLQISRKATEFIIVNVNFNITTQQLETKGERWLIFTRAINRKSQEFLRSEHKPFEVYWPNRGVMWAFECYTHFADSHVS